MPRDFLGKLHLGLLLIDKGLRVVISSKTMEDLISYFPESVVICSPYARDYLLNPAPKKWAVQPDEGAFFQELDWEASILAKYGIKYMGNNPPDRIFVWGDEQKEVIDSALEPNRSRVVVTGSPRLDLCSDEGSYITDLETGKVRKKYGSFILITTHFGSLNGQIPLERAHRQFLKRLVNTDDRQGSDAFLNKWTKDAVDFGLFVSAVRSLLREFPEQVFIIRPHPGEKLETYETLFKGFSNVRVVREGNVLPWIKASQLLFTSNCTTATEGVLAGKNVINYLPNSEIGRNYNVAIASESGSIANSIDGVVDLVKSALLGEKLTRKPWTSKAVRRLRNLSEQATPNFVKEICVLAEDIEETPLRLSKLEKAERVELLRQRLRRRAPDYHAQKTTGLPLGIVEHVVKGSNPSCVVQYSSESTVVIEPSPRFD